MGKRGQKVAKYKFAGEISHQCENFALGKISHSGVKFSHPDAKISTFSAPLPLLLISDLQGRV